MSAHAACLHLEDREIRDAYLKAAAFCDQVFGLAPSPEDRTPQLAAS